jgi:hypothetical protein
MKIHKTCEAVAWMRNNPKATQKEAAEHFGITQAAVSARYTMESMARHACIGRDMDISAAKQYLTSDPHGTWRGVATQCGIGEELARQVCVVAMSEAAGEKYAVVAESERTKALREAASMARLIGGEAGEQIAQAIESL